MILIDICEGLLWMHTHSSGSTAHGDLKPENVLLRPNCRAFLCDLGGSAPLDQQLTSKIGEMGTFEYNSPERVMDSKGTPTPASDVWSLGVLAYRMVTGKSLFDGLQVFQMTVALSQFNESKIPLSIDPSVREVLLKMLEPNVALRATTTTLFEGGLLERMLGAETARSKMKNIQLATRGNEIKESLSDSTLKEKTIELEMEKLKLLDETKELESKPRSLQMTLKRTYNRNHDLEMEEELGQPHQLLTTQTASFSINPEDNVISQIRKIPGIDSGSLNPVWMKASRRTFIRDELEETARGQWSTSLFKEPVSEGVVSVGITIQALPDEDFMVDWFMFGLIDAQALSLKHIHQLGVDIPNSFAYSTGKGRLRMNLPSTKHEAKKIHIVVKKQVKVK
ncbi:putative Protein kinase domain containing protein [Blattamonas nauphoetae]|uniref:non-specific serine/threonine protein kinase n=1 Tax=Blattamonas nauphoetae TaxID=2049346 RepID=A0ABQ9XTP5_9EUKA|nr:putative Protein kinase domain containing protein [Blattamonas nauphoetae]